VLDDRHGRHLPGEAERVQLRRPRRRHPPARLAEVQLLLVRPLLVDLAAEPWVLGLALRHVAVAVPPWGCCELGVLRVLAHGAMVSFAAVLADRHGRYLLGEAERV
jgi:hypothetical protein